MLTGSHRDGCAQLCLALPSPIPHPLTKALCWEEGRRGGDPGRGLPVPSLKPHPFTLSRSLWVQGRDLVLERVLGHITCDLQWQITRGN